MTDSVWLVRMGAKHPWIIHGADEAALAGRCGWEAVEFLPATRLEAARLALDDYLANHDDQALEDARAALDRHTKNT